VTINQINENGVRSLSDAAGLSLKPNEAEVFARLGEGLLGLMATVEDLPSGAGANARQPQAAPESDKGPDPLNAFARRCRVYESGEGDRPLEGVRVAVKDCIAVAGVELSAGSSVLRGFVPSRHSTVVSRLVSAGASIEAITNMDCLAMSAAGDSSVFGPTLCPQDPTRLAGGSSSGSAACLHYEDIDISIGTDTGGSVRVPSSWCGVLGLKPTYGLVSYRGVVSVDHRFDHVGPMARTARELARVMDVMAGWDALDPRQTGGRPELQFEESLSRYATSLPGVRVGVMAEGTAEQFGVEPAVREAFQAGVEAMRRLGISVVEVSVPEQATAGPIMFSMLAEGFAALMAAGGNGYQWEGEYWPELADAIHAGMRDGAGDLSPQVKMAMILGRYAQAQYSGRRYAQAANGRSQLRAGYDRALADCDFVILPTVPALPYKNDISLPLEDRIMRSWATVGNTSSTNITGHPAISLPLATASSLPVGVMAVGRHHADADLVAFAAALEAAVGWNSIAVA